jgi:hypothetical protein
MIRVFIGYDANETVAFHALNHSIQANASQPVAVTPVMLSQLKGIFKRDNHHLQSTQFSFSRFLVPYLCNYEGWAIFMDCDMLLRGDISELWNLRDDRHAVQVVKHDHRPKEAVKFLNNAQTKYEKKNWSSVMLFNCKRCTALTPDFVNTASGLQLHQFKWLSSDNEIGEIPQEWNHLVGYNEFNPNAKNVHYTEGGPYFDEYVNCDYAADWFATRDQMMEATQRSMLPVEKKASGQ